MPDEMPVLPPPPPPPTTTTTTTTTTATAAAAAAAAAAATTRRRVGFKHKKGYKKSKTGCLSCKSRKVKCDEAVPRCGACERVGLDCRFAPPLPWGKHKQGLERAAGLRGALRCGEAQFTLDELNFFQHFLFNAFPSLPVCGWKVWQEVGRMSHTYDFLIHSMLALGASHLNLLGENIYAKEALEHRVKAIQTLNKHLTGRRLSKADGDAAFAAMLVLTFQCSYLPDGLIDFFSMVRGCFVIGTGAIVDFETSIFEAFAPRSYEPKVPQLVRASAEDDCCLDETVAAQFCASLNRIAPLCRSWPEIEYLAKMRRVIRLASTPSLSLQTAGHHEYSCLYDKLGTMVHSDFASFIDPKNHASRLIMLHLLVLELVMSREDVEARGGVRPGNTDQSRVSGGRKLMAFEWIDRITAHLPSEYWPYTEWLVSFSEALVSRSDSENWLWQRYTKAPAGAAVIRRGADLRDLGS